MHHWDWKFFVCWLCLSASAWAQPAATTTETPATADLPAAPVEPEARETAMEEPAPAMGTEVSVGTPDADPIVATVKEMQAVLDRYRLVPPSDLELREVVVLALARAADPGARLLTPDDVRKMEKLERGIVYDAGLHLTRSNATARVTRVESGSPAAEAGILPDDIVVDIDGSDASLLHIAELTARLRGLEPATVEVRVRTGDQTPRRATVKTVEQQLEPVAEAHDLPAGLGYVRLNGLFPAAGAAVVTELLSMVERGLSGVVLDIRGADGRDAKSVVDIAGLLTPPRTRLFSFRDAEGRDLEVHHAAMQKPIGIPMMILVDANTTGSAELLAAVVHGSGRGAMLLGAPTAGDPMVRDRVALDDGLLLYLATRRLQVGERESYSGLEPIVPDIRIDPDVRYPDYVPEPPLLTDRRGITDDEVEARQLRRQVRGDIALTRAVDVLMGLKALNINGFVNEADPDR